MSIDLNPETYNPEAGWYYTDDDELARDLGWDTYDDAIQSIADRFGYDDFDALVDDVAWGTVESIRAFEAGLTPAEHIIWTNLA